MLRFLSAAFVLLLAGVIAAEAGTPFRDASSRFTLTVPDGWRGAPNPQADSPIALIMAREGDQFGVCVVIVIPYPMSKDVSQEDLNEAGTSLFTKDYWRSSMIITGAKNVDIEDTSSEERDGRKIFYVTISAEMTSNGIGGRLKTKQAMHLIPGAMHAVSCVTKAELYAAVAADFDAIFASYRPLTGLIAQGPRAPSSTLTLFAGARYDGERRVLSASEPALAQRPTGSLAVTGATPWQICEGAGYQGRCGVLRGGATQSFGPSGLRIGSVRKLSSGPTRVDLRALGAAAQQALAQNYDAALRALSRRR